MSANPISSSGTCLYQNGQGTVVLTAAAAAAAYNFRQAVTAPLGQVLCGRHDKSNGNNSTNTEILSGGGLAATGNILNGGTLSGNITGGAWQIMKGDTGGGTNYFLGWMEGLIIREALDSNADVNSISLALGG